MQTIKTIFTTALASSMLLIGHVQADELMNIIHPESADLFDHSDSIKASGTTGIVSLGDVTSEHVWSYEYEEYVNPADFVLIHEPATVAQAQKMLQDNPTAAGSGGQTDVFMWDEVADEFYLQ